MFVCVVSVCVCDPVSSVRRAVCDGAGCVGGHVFVSDMCGSVCVDVHRCMCVCMCTHVLLRVVLLCMFSCGADPPPEGTCHRPQLLDLVGDTFIASALSACGVVAWMKLDALLCTSRADFERCNKL